MSIPLVEILEDPLQSTFSSDLSSTTRLAIANGIWGDDETPDSRDELLGFFFSYYIKETLSARLSGSRHRHEGATQIRTHQELIDFIGLVKSAPQTPRKAIKATIKADEALSKFDADSALDLGVKTMLMISCISAKNVITTGHIYRPQWRDSETLEEMIDRALPRHEIEATFKPEPIRAQNLRYAYVSAYAKVSIEWTDNLPDHLCLQITDQWKTLKLFKHVALLELSLRSAASDEQRMSAVHSLNWYVSKLESYV
jgi:hypothetical protein